MGTRVNYPVKIKMKAIELRMQGVPVKDVMSELNIRNKTKLKTWMSWYREGQLHRLQQSVGKQYTYGKGNTYTSEVEKLQAEIRFLNQQLDVLKKYKALERMWIEQ